MHVVTSSSVDSIETIVLRANTWTLNGLQHFVRDTAVSTQKMTRYGRNLGCMASFPLCYPDGYKKRIKRKFLLNVQSSTDKKLSTTQDRQTLQDTVEKQYCQYCMPELLKV